MRLAAVLLIAAVATGAAAQSPPERRPGEAPPLQCTGEMEACVATCTAAYNTCVGTRDGFVCRPRLERCNATCRGRYCATSPGTR